MDVLNPCPTCGLRFDFQMTGCMTHVAEALTAGSAGNCPKCGTRVVFEERSRLGEFATAQTLVEKRLVKLADLDIALRCTLRLRKLGVETLGELLGLPVDDLRRHLEDMPTILKDLEAKLQPLR